MNPNVYILTMCFLDVTIGFVNPKGGVAAFETSHIIASKGKRKELSCVAQASDQFRSVSWYRRTNEDGRKCPNGTYLLTNDEVFCDRLTNNRIVQNGFEQRFSVTDNNNGLVITRVELSDAGIYACVESSNNTIHARIILTVEEDVKQTTPENQERTTEEVSNASTMNPLEAIPMAEVRSMTFMFVIASGLFGFLSGLFFAAGVKQIARRCGIMPPDESAAKLCQIELKPEEGTSYKQAKTAQIELVSEEGTSKQHMKTAGS